jgi:hypothetical protein
MTEGINIVFIDSTSERTLQYIVFTQDTQI